MQQNVTKKIFLYATLIFLIILVAILIIMFVYRFVQNPSSNTNINYQSINNQVIINSKPYIDKFITAVPFDLNQIASMSKFRSCSGHDYSSANVDGQQETNRSMKHYINPLDSLIGSVNSIKIFAPFDGTVAAITANSENDNAQGGMQVWLTPTDNPTWSFNFYHIIPIVKASDIIKAGQLIGYANLSYSLVRDFDIALEAWVQNVVNPLGPENLGNLNLALQRVPNYLHLLHTGQLDSIFNHMDPEVLAQFAAKGISKQNIIVSKVARDASPCPQPQSNGYYESTPNDNVILR